MKKIIESKFCRFTISVLIPWSSTCMHGKFRTISPINIAGKLVIKQEGKFYYALNFKNNSGGYELRNEYFKGGSSPKGIKSIENGAKPMEVFEGFFNFLSYLILNQKQGENLPNFLILDSASFFEKNIPRRLEHSRVHLYLDNGKTGQNSSQQGLNIDREKFQDERQLY